MRIKYVDSNYDKKSGVSIVIMRTKYGTYEGIAREHPKEEYRSHLYGCQLAEARACQKALKEAIRYKKAELKGAERSYATCPNKQTYGVAKGIKKELKELKLELNDYKVQEKTLRTDREEAIQLKKKVAAPNVLANRTI